MVVKYFPGIFIKPFETIFQGVPAGNAETVDVYDIGGYYGMLQPLYLIQNFLSVLYVFYRSPARNCSPRFLSLSEIPLPVSRHKNRAPVQRPVSSLKREFFKLMEDFRSHPVSAEAMICFVHMIHVFGIVEASFSFSPAFLV